MIAVQASMFPNWKTLKNKNAYNNLQQFYSIHW